MCLLCKGTRGDFFPLRCRNIDTSQDINIDLACPPPSAACLPAGKGVLASFVVGPFTYILSAPTTKKLQSVLIGSVRSKSANHKVESRSYPYYGENMPGKFLRHVQKSCLANFLDMYINFVMFFLAFFPKF